jgi:hypothetical protein
MVGQPSHVKQLSLNHVCKIGLNIYMYLCLSLLVCFFVSCVSCFHILSLTSSAILLYLHILSFPLDSFSYPGLSCIFYLPSFCIFVYRLLCLCVYCLFLLSVSRPSCFLFRFRCLLCLTSPLVPFSCLLCLFVLSPLRYPFLVSFVSLY